MVAVVAVVVVLALLGWFLLTRPDDSRSSASPDTSARPTPTSPPRSSAPGGTTGPSTTTPDSPATPLPEDPELTKAVDEAIAFIERVRGVEFVSRPAVEVLADRAFVKSLSDLLDQDAESLRVTGRLLTALGLIEPETDIVEAQRALLGAGVLGYYDPKSKRLVVRAASITPLTRVIITHELTHALDDQLSGLDRPALEKTTDETGFAFRMLAEGSAKYVENELRASLLPGEQQQLQAEEMRVGVEQTPGLLNTPAILLTLTQAPYSLGEPLVRAIVARNGVGGLAAAFAAPPTTTEQGFETLKYFSAEGAAPVPAPPADGAATDDGALGALVLDAMVGGDLSQLKELTTGPALDPDVDGWSGDHYVVWDNAQGAPCVRFDVKMDTTTEREALSAGLAAWSGRVGGASIESQGSDTLRATRCASGAAGGESPA